MEVTNYTPNYNETRARLLQLFDPPKSPDDDEPSAYSAVKTDGLLFETQLFMRDQGKTFPVGAPLNDESRGICVFWYDATGRYMVQLCIPARADDTHMIQWSRNFGEYGWKEVSVRNLAYLLETVIEKGELP